MQHKFEKINSHISYLLINFSDLELGDLIKYTFAKELRKINLNILPSFLSEKEIFVLS